MALICFSPLLHEQLWRIKTTVLGSLRVLMNILALAFIFMRSYFKNLMLMEEDRANQLHRKGVLKRLLPLFLLWVICVSSVVVTFTSGNGEFECSLEKCFIQRTF